MAFILKMADLTVGIKNKYKYAEAFCRDYIATDAAAADCDFIVEASDEEINAEQDGNYPAYYLETLALYRKIAAEMQKYEGFLMHGVVLETGGVGVAFLALSGTGKSTHARLWKQLLGEKMRVINGDKPLVRYSEKDGTFYAYGTPWAGKEGEQTNAKTPLRKICFLERSEKNECVKLPGAEALERMLGFIYVKDGNALLSVLDLLEKAEEKTEFYIIRCNMDPESAGISYGVVMGHE